MTSITLQKFINEPETLIRTVMSVENYNIDALHLFKYLGSPTAKDTKGQPIFFGFNCMEPFFFVCRWMEGLEQGESLYVRPDLSDVMVDADQREVYTLPTDDVVGLFQLNARYYKS